MSQKAVRIGLHDFLNAQPLLVPLRNEAEKNNLQVVVEVPSQLADMLSAGTLDLAMIPTVEYLKEAARYRPLPRVCIASRGQVGTVLLVSKVPIEGIRTLALDNRSRTSAALLKILFGKEFRRGIAFETSAPDPEAMLNAHDAALIIGDQNFFMPKWSFETQVYDLSEVWFRQTGKTFVHAVLAVRDEVVLPMNICAAIHMAMRLGLKNLSAIGSDQAESRGLDSNVCEEYLRHRIIYHLGEQELAGMRLFQEICCERGIIPEKHRIHFIEDPTSRG